MGQAVASSIGFSFFLFLCAVPTRIYMFGSFNATMVKFLVHTLTIMSVADDDSDIDFNQFHSPPRCRSVSKCN